MRNLQNFPMISVQYFFVSMSRFVGNMVMCLSVDSGVGVVFSSELGMTDSSSPSVLNFELQIVLDLASEEFFILLRK